MKEADTKSKPIPTRHDADVLDMIERIHVATGVPKAEIIRRAVRYALEFAKRTKSLNFLLGDEASIMSALADDQIEEKGFEALREVDKALERMSEERAKLEQRIAAPNSPFNPFAPVPTSSRSAREVGDALHRLTPEVKARDLEIRLNEPVAPYKPSEPKRKED